MRAHGDHPLECYVCGPGSPCGPVNKDKRTCNPPMEDSCATFVLDSVIKKNCTNALSCSPSGIGDRKLRRDIALTARYREISRYCKIYREIPRDNIARYRDIARYRANNPSTLLYQLTSNFNAESYTRLHNLTVETLSCFSKGMPCD